MTPQDYEDVTDATVLETLADGSIFENDSAEAPSSGGNVRSWRNEDLEGQVTAAAEKILKPLLRRNLRRAQDQEHQSGQSLRRKEILCPWSRR